MDRARPTDERLLVCVGSSPSSIQVVNAAGRTAAEMGAKWWAVHVEQLGVALGSEVDRVRAAGTLALAARLGAETVTLPGRDIAGTILAFARQHRVTRLIVGAPAPSRWRHVLSGSPVDRLVRTSGDIDVWVTTGEPVEQRERPYVPQPTTGPLSDYGAGVLYVVLATALCAMMFPYFHLSNLIMVYLVGVLLTATGCGRGPAILTSLLSVLAFDFFFVPPRFSFTVAEGQYLVTFVVMALVALVISHLTAGMRQQTALARLQERQAAAMHGLSRQLAGTRGTDDILALAVRHVADVFDADVVALVPDAGGKLHVAAGDLSAVVEKDLGKELAVAHAAYDGGRMVGWGAEAAPTTRNVYVPLRAAHATSALLALRPHDPDRFLLHEQLSLLESLAKQIALALEVERVSGARAGARDATTA